ncbi:hypothetical protein XENOCAPTIV_011963 [Xenoophorus captivus]|uniref:Uncharacterized protein n=1 Tax=Xenoophorus captivus TaxID=1517983 RepID=A0ABV0QD56_9TELE
MCHGREYLCHTQVVKAIERQKGRIQASKAYTVETEVLSQRVGNQHVYMRMHLFPRESISKAGFHYQYNGLPGCCSCCTRWSASGAHSGSSCSGGGQWRISGQDRTPGARVNYHTRGGTSNKSLIFAQNFSNKIQQFKSQQFPLNIIY